MIPSETNEKNEKLVLIVQVQSAAQYAGNFAHIICNGYPVKMKCSEKNSDQKGLHMVVINPKTSAIEHAEVFDTS